MTLPIPVLCFKVGLQCKCLQEWKRPKGEFDGAYHEVKIVKTIRASPVVPAFASAYGNEKWPSSRMQMQTQA
jgi:hypothetical protein